MRGANRFLEGKLVICSQNIETCYEVGESVAIQIKTTEKYFLVMLFIMLYKVVLAFEFRCKLLSSTHL